MTPRLAAVPLVVAIVGSLALAGRPVLAQAPAPVESAPIAPPPVAPSPVSPPPGAPAPVAPPPAAGSPAAATPVAALPSLIPQPGDPSDVDEVVLPAKPVLILTGSSSWDEGLKTLRGAFGRLTSELGKDGVAPAGRPLAVFLDTTDDTFKYDAMVPIAAVPSPAPTLPAGMRFGTTPSGKAYRFVHKAAYDDIDSTYETVTTYLDAKDIVAKDAFIEEYLNDVADPGDPNLEINIFVQPK